MPFLLFTHVCCCHVMFLILCRYKVLKSPSILTQSLHLVFFFVEVDLLESEFSVFVFRNILISSLFFPFIASFSFVFAEYFATYRVLE